MKTEDAVGYIDRMISEQEDYKVYALGHRSDDEELLSDIESGASYVKFDLDETGPRDSKKRKLVVKWVAPTHVRGQQGADTTTVFTVK